MADKIGLTKKNMIIIAVAIVVIIILVLLFFRKTDTKVNKNNVEKINQKIIDVYNVELPTLVCEGSDVVIKGITQVRTDFHQNKVDFIIMDKINNLLYQKSEYLLSGDNIFQFSFKPKDYSVEDYTFIVKYKERESFRKNFNLKKESPKIEVKPVYEMKQVDEGARGKLTFYKVSLHVNSLSSCDISNIKIIPRAFEVIDQSKNLAKSFYGSEYDGFSIKKLTGHTLSEHVACILHKDRFSNEEQAYGVSIIDKIERLCYVYLDKPQTINFNFVITADGNLKQEAHLQFNVEQIGYTDWKE